MTSAACIEIEGVGFRYGDRLALDDVSLTVGEGEIFGLLGPNGGGKTTLFRLLTTYFPIQQGRVAIHGVDAAADPHGIRSMIGVVFQHPSLDPKLTVAENLKHHARLYGVPRSEVPARIKASLDDVALSDRKSEVVERLSGGLARRAELAKGLLHRPRLLILDEPTAGLDPGARSDLWRRLRTLKDEQTTVLLTTHLMDEAERCDRLAVLDEGKIIAVGTPDELRGRVGGRVIALRCPEPETALRRIEQTLQLNGTVVEGSIRIESAEPFELVPKIVESAGVAIESLEISQPTLEDVFIQLTGHRFWKGDGDGA